MSTSASVTAVRFETKRYRPNRGVLTHRSLEIDSKEGGLYSCCQMSLTRLAMKAAGIANDTGYLTPVAN